MADNDEIDVDIDIDDLERQIAMMDGGDVGTQPKAKAKKVADDDDIDVDKLLAELSDGGGEAEAGEGDDDEDYEEMYGEKPKKKETSVKPDPKKPQTKSSGNTTQPSSTKTTPVNKPPPGGDIDITVGQDSNGVSEDVLIEEENIYHTKEDIFSITCMNYEIENYIDPIIDKQLVGSDYRDSLEMQKDEWQMYVDSVMSRIESGKMSPEKYLEFVYLGKKSQTQILEKAIAKKASKTTIDRIKKRLELLDGEIADLKEQPGGEGQPMDEEEPQAPKEEVKPKAPSKPKYQVAEAKLEKLSSVLNQYLYFLMYCHENGIDNMSMMAKVKDVKNLFRDPYSITTEQYLAAMDKLEPITIEMILGMEPADRNAQLDVMLEEAEQAFEMMKSVTCTKEEAKDTAETIKYLRKIKETPIIRLPKVSTHDLLKQAPNKHNPNIPEDCVRFTLVKLSGAAGHRTIFAKYSFEYGGAHMEGDTPYVKFVNIA